MYLILFYTKVRKFENIKEAIPLISQAIVDKAEVFIQEHFKDDKTGHDWYHIERVYKMAMELQSIEGGNKGIVQLAALFHDFTDSKLKANPDEAELQMRDCLYQYGVIEEDVKRIIDVIDCVSFSKGKKVPLNIEMQIVQDADRLDAIGAIGIARCLTYGAAMQRPIYDPNHKEGTTMQHFHDKLLQIKDKIQTSTAKKIAIRRHKVLESYLKELENECNIQF